MQRREEGVQRREPFITIHWHPVGDPGHSVACSHSTSSPPPSTRFCPTLSTCFCPTCLHPSAPPRPRPRPCTRAPRPALSCTPAYIVIVTLVDRHDPQSSQSAGCCLCKDRVGRAPTPQSIPTRGTLREPDVDRTGTDSAPPVYTRGAFADPALSLHSPHPHTHLRVETTCLVDHFNKPERW